MYSNMILIYSMRIVAKPIPLIRNNEGDAIAIAENPRKNFKGLILFVKQPT